MERLQTPPGGKITSSDTPGGSTATAHMDGGTCFISYTSDLYQQHRHRDGEQITVDGVSVTLRIEEITP